ncbi:MAG TPA: hypothetical protein VEV63_08060 [Streptosporangiaceae bacterium]|nr:hypothetical protein [Streptosporangiaceae bacterium]
MRPAGSAVTNSAGRFTLRLGAAAAAKVKAEANRNGVLNLALGTTSSKGWDWFGFSRLTKARTRDEIVPDSLPHWGTPQAATLHLMPVSANEPKFPICTGIIDAGPIVGSKDGLESGGTSPSPGP